MEKPTEQIMARQQADIRREAFVRQILYSLRGTIRLRPLKPEVDVAEVDVELTDATARVLAPLAEAVDILEAIIFASDGCVGHRQCAHSMEPWQRARTLLKGKWQAYEDHRPWPDVRVGETSDDGVTS